MWYLCIKASSVALLQGIGSLSIDLNLKPNDRNLLTCLVPLPFFEEWEIPESEAFCPGSEWWFFCPAYSCVHPMVCALRLSTCRTCKITLYTVQFYICGESSISNFFMYNTYMETTHSKDKLNILEGIKHLRGSTVDRQAVHREKKEYIFKRKLYNKW